MPSPLNQAFGTEGRLDQGSNGSEALAINKNGHISIGLPETNKLLKFKAFVTDYSRSTESSYEQDNFSVSDSPRFIKGVVKNQIKLSFDIPSHSMNEARINLQRVQELCRFFLSNTVDLKEFTHNPEYYTVYILFSNFIHSMGAVAIVADSYSEVKTRGEKCVFTGFSFEIDIESGFFEGDINIDTEDDGKLIPKKMSVTMELTPIIEVDSYYEKFSKEDDIESMPYPFGINYKR
mgnify:FL=1